MSVKLPAKTSFAAKDQLKSDRATRFIGRGSERSSTNAYAKAWGSLANCGAYMPYDIVFVSAEGSRRGRLLPNLNEIALAMRTKVTIITDIEADRLRPYNSGERYVAEFLVANGYQEVEPGVWKSA
jgi:hypothetical protein